jgi:small conductance mechanosensitive channel
MDWKQLAADIEAWFGKTGLWQRLALALIIYFVGTMVARLIRVVIYKAFLRGSHDETLSRFMSNMVFQVLRIFVVVIMLGSLGVDTTSLAALVGGAGVAIGFALRDTLGNFAAGVILILRRPFEEGHVIEAAGVLGVVEEITIVATKMRSLDNKAIVVPNGLIFGGVITNYNGNDTRRVDLVAGIGYGDDIDKARDLIRDILRENPLVLETPESEVFIAALADSSVNFNVRPWCKSEDYFAVSAEVTEAIKKRFDAAGISIPFPQQDVHLHQVG